MNLNLPEMQVKLSQKNKRLPEPRRWFVCFCFFILLASCASQPSVLVNNDITHSPVDQRDYRSLVLPNGLEVLLVSDMDAEKAAAAIDVSVGSGDDDRAGIAHFLEHMLFLGTEKYPNAGEYQAFISAHGGQHNAYTSYEHTNYFFDVNPAYFNEALDRFSRFFIDPLFSEQYVEREKHAVDSEYQAKIRSEARRSLDVFRELVSPGHRYGKFSVGSLDTLEGENLREDVMAFYGKHYSADRMKLVVLAPQSLDDLQQTVYDMFSSISRFETNRQLSNVPLLNEQSLQNLVYIEPLVDKKELTFSFQVPLIREYSSERPLHYIGHILGHEGEGSLLELLKKKGLATGLAAGPGLDALDAASMVIQIELTDAGFEQRDQVIEYVFAAIESTRQQGVLERIYSELATTSELNFRYQQTSSPLGTVSTLANYLHRFPASDVLYANYRMDTFDPELIRSYLDAMRPENSVIAVTAKNIQPDRSSPWYFTPYRIEPFAAEQLQRWQQPEGVSEFSAPLKNRLLPEDLALKQMVDDQKPMLIKEQPWKFWIARDTSFRLPRANIRLNLRSAIANNTAINSAMLDMYVEMVREKINVLAYDAYLANMRFGIATHGRGLSVEVSGYSDKQDVLLAELASAMSDPVISSKQFVAIKDKLTRQWRDHKKKQPYAYLLGEVSMRLLDPSWSPETLAEKLENVTQQEVATYASQFLDSVQMEVLVHGNYQKDEAARVIDHFVSSLGAQFIDQRPEFRIKKLDKAQRLQHKVVLPHADSAVAYYWQSPERGYKARAAFALAAQIIQPRFFDELRTEKQLGYVVFTTNMPMLDVPGISFVVQSPRSSAESLAQEVDDFINRQWLELAEMPESQFVRNKAALLAKLTEEPQRLNQLTDDYWGDIAMGYYGFDDREKLVAVLEQLQFDDWLIFVSQAFRQGGHIVFWAAGDKPADVPLDWRSIEAGQVNEFYQID